MIISYAKRWELLSQRPECRSDYEKVGDFPEVKD